MYAFAVAGSVAAGSAVALPHFQLGSLDIGIPIQSFGVIVAAGVLIGAALLRRYAEWHGVSDEHIRGILGWITITGFLGAHWFDVLAYEPHKLSEPMATWPPSKWPVLLRIWDGISSYGGFVGGAVGFAIYVWWKRLPVRLFADISIVGLLPAFSIGRIGCTVVSDHIGAVVDKANWYAALAMDYPFSEMPNKDGVVNRIATVQGAPVINEALSQPDEYGKALFVGNPDHTITMWNLGLIEFLYLIPVNLIVLRLAFRSSKRMPAGFIVVLAGIMYAPVRFFLDYLRPVSSDARHGGLTFAQWCSIIAFGVAVYAATRVLKNGKPAETVTKTSKEAQQRLKLILKEDEEKAEREKEEGKKTEKKADLPKATAAEKEKEKKGSGVADKKEEVPPTEMDMPVLSRDIVKKSEKGEGKKEEGKKEEGKKDEGKKDEAKKDEAKKDEAKKDEAKKDEAKKDEAKKDETKKDEAKKDEAKKDEAKKDEAKKDEAKKDAKKDEAKKDDAKKDDAKKEEAKKEEAKKDDAKKGEAKKEEAKKEEAKKEEAKKEEAKKDEAKKDEAKKDEAKKDEAKKDEAKKEETKEEKKAEEKAEEKKADDTKADDKKADDKK